MTVLAEGRRFAEARMTDSCRIRAEGGARVWDEATGAYLTTDPVYSYEGPCRVKYGATQPHDVDAAGQTLTEQQIELHLPVLESAGVEPDHVVEMTGSVDDPALPGRVFRVTGRFGGSTTARRFPVEEVS